MPSCPSVAGVLDIVIKMDDPRISRLSIEFNRAKQEEKDRLSFSREDGALPDFHRIDLEGLMKFLNLTDTDAGLSDTAVADARKIYGRNIIQPPKANPIWMWLGFFFGGFNGFLWFAAALSWVAWALGYLVRSLFCPTLLPCGRARHLRSFSPFLFVSLCAASFPPFPCFVPRVFASAFITTPLLTYGRMLFGTL